MKMRSFAIAAALLLTAFSSSARAMLHPGMGRFLQRDAAKYIDGINQYQYVRSNPITHVDPTGLWDEQIHLRATRTWAIARGYPFESADAIGRADADVDSGATAPWPWIGDQSYHFDRNQGRGRDSRLMHYDEHLQRARSACSDWRSSGVRIMSSFSRDEPETAARELGTALHPYQDWVAHGEHAIYDDGGIFRTHNAFSPQRDFDKSPSSYPDDPFLDAVNGVDGRPAGLALHVYTTYMGVSTREYAIYQRGTQRLRLTSRMTIETLNQFREYVRQFGGCQCRRYFGI